MFDELPPKGHYTECKLRLLDTGGQLITAMTPPTEARYEIWVPEEHARQVKTVLPKLRRIRSPPQQGAVRLASARLKGGGHFERHYHFVTKGETLGAIARRYKVSVAYLKRINGLRSIWIQAGMRLRVSTRSYRHS